MRGYIWEPDWCWPYESAWSIIEKFKYANAVTNDAFKRIFGLRSTSPEWNMIQDLYIYRRSNLNENEFIKFFQISDTHFSYLEKFRNNDFTQVFRKELHYCPKCMQLGYHSYLHQLSFADTCPFHDEQLLRLDYNGNSIPYSIDYTTTEAYSVMQAKEKQPAERYIDILPSRKLIDGIWQITPNYIKIDDSSVLKIIFFNPSIKPSEQVQSIRYSTLKLVDSLRDDSKNIKCKPILNIDSKHCDSEYKKLLVESRDWFESNYQLFHKNNLECWFIAMLIEELIQNIDEEVLRYSISNMQRHQFYYRIDREEYIKASAAVITAYIITNARDLYEGVDKSIIHHFSIHNKVNRCTFSIFDIDNYVNSKGVTDKYIPFFIFKRLFKKLYNHIFTMLKSDVELSFDYSKIAVCSVPDYVISLSDTNYEIYEVDD